MTSKKKIANFAIDRADRRSLVDQVADGLRSAIVSGFYKVGDLLPPREILARELGVSARVTREALVKLAKENLVNPRQRLGSVVLAPGSAIWYGHVVCVWNETDESTYFAARMVGALRRKLISSGYLFTSLALQRKEDGKVDLSVLDSIFSRGVDLSVSFGTPPEVNLALSRKNTPFVNVGHTHTKQPGCIGSVRINYNAAVPTFVAECCKQKVKSVLQAGFNDNDINAERALAKAGIKTECIQVPISGKAASDSLETQVRNAMNVFLKRFPTRDADLPDVILFTDDFFAFGALTALTLNGIRIPDDVKVVTLSNKGLCPVHPREFTRMEFDFASYGEIVADYALARLAGKEAPSSVDVNPVYIPGETF